MIEYNDPHDKEYDPLSGCIGYAIGAIIGIVICIIMGSCTTTRYIDNYVIQHDTLRLVNLQHDSINVHDSIFVDRWMKGDTCYINKYVEHTKYKDRLRIDTVYKVKTDSITCIETMEVEKKLTWWQKFQMTMGCIMMVGVLCVLIWLAVKFDNKIKQ